MLNQGTYPLRRRKNGKEMRVNWHQHAHKQRIRSDCSSIHHSKVPRAAAHAALITLKWVNFKLCIFALENSRIFKFIFLIHNTNALMSSKENIQFQKYQPVYSIVCMCMIRQIRKIKYSLVKHNGVLSQRSIFFEKTFYNMTQRCCQGCFPVPEPQCHQGCI